MLFPLFPYDGMIVDPCIGPDLLVLYILVKVPNELPLGGPVGAATTYGIIYYK